MLYKKLMLLEVSILTKFSFPLILNVKKCRHIGKKINEEMDT